MTTNNESAVMTEEQLREGLTRYLYSNGHLGSRDILEEIARVSIAYLRAHSPEAADILDDEKLVRDSFERWIKAPPFERDIARLDESSAWPGRYKEYEIELAWCAWQDARKGVSARVRYLNGAVQNLGKMVAGQAAAFSDWNYLPAEDGCPANYHHKSDGRRVDARLVSPEMVAEVERLNFVNAQWADALVDADAEHDRLSEEINRLTRELADVSISRDEWQQLASDLKLLVEAHTDLQALEVEFGEQNGQ